MTFPLLFSDFFQFGYIVRYLDGAMVAFAVGANHVINYRDNSRPVAGGPRVRAPGRQATGASCFC